MAEKSRVAEATPPARARKARNRAWIGDAKHLAKLEPERFQDELRRRGLERRTGYYLREIGSHLAAGRIPDSDALRIGWTKLAIILEHEELKTRNTPRLLRLAATSTASELQRQLRQRRGAPRPRCLQFRFTDEEYERVRSALLSAGAARMRKGAGLAKKEVALLKLIGG